MTSTPRSLIALAGLFLLFGPTLPGCAPRAKPPLWQGVVIPTDADFDGMWFTDSLNGWIAGGSYQIDGGIVGRTRDGGRTWAFRSGLLPSPPGSRFHLHRIQFLDSLRGIAACDAGVILVTDDGGESWRPVHHGRSMGDGLFDVQFIDSRRGWAAGASILGTSDGGESWGALVYGSAENGYLSGTALHFVDDRRGWLVGPFGRLMRTQDGGSNWEAVELPLRPGEKPHLFDITFCDALHGWIVGERGNVFHTEDGGETWARQENGIPTVRRIPKGEPPRPRDPIPGIAEEPSQLFLTSVSFADPQNGCAVGSYQDAGESVVLRTSDGGASWRLERTLPGEELRVAFMLNPSHAWAVGDRVREGDQVVLRYTGAGR